MQQFQRAFAMLLATHLSHLDHRKADTDDDGGRFDKLGYELD